MPELNPRDGFVVRSWNGQDIRMRAGRVCLTDLCKAGETGSGNAIRFSNWFESEATQRFLLHRSMVTGREVFAISAFIDNAENSALIVRESERGDAWGDEVVSLKLAGRLCTELEHEIYQWYAETRVSQVRDTQPAIPMLPAPAEQVKAAAEGLVFIWDALESRGLADDRDRIELKRDLKVLHTALVQTTAGSLPGTSNVLSAVDRLPRFLGRAVDVDAPLTFVEWAAAYLPAELSSVVNKYDQSLGMEMHKQYKVRYNEEAPTTTHLSTKAEEGRRRLGLPLFGQAKNGVACTPRIYLPKDWDLFVVAMRHKGLVRPDKAAELLAECQQFRAGMDF
jgi:hypothetical protein